MAVFSKVSERADHISNITTISEGTSISGSITIECALHVDGEIHGNIDCADTVTIGQSGLVKGDINAQKLFISGSFNGKAECGFIELIDGGKVDGQLVSSHLAINSDVYFNAQSVSPPSDKSHSPSKGAGKEGEES